MTWDKLETMYQKAYAKAIIASNSGDSLSAWRFIGISNRILSAKIRLINNIK